MIQNKNNISLDIHHKKVIFGNFALQKIKRVMKLHKISNPNSPFHIAQKLTFYMMFLFQALNTKQSENLLHLHALQIE